LSERGDDRELVARFLAGEREGFGQLVRRHAGPLWATLRRNLGDEEEARDVFQETWLRAFERLGDLRDVGRLRSWLVSIAMNLVRQGHRRRARQTRLEELPEAGLPVQEEGLLGLEAEDELAFLRRRIASLPPRQREVFDLRLNHGLGHGEIGAMLDITAESSRASYYQALRRLRDEYEGREDPRATRSNP